MTAPRPSASPIAEWRRRLLAPLMQEDINFLLTNRLPRRAATRIVGRLSRIEQPLVARALIALWRTFSAVDLSDAAETRFDSLHAGFTRALRPGARPIDADDATIVSPCDAIVGAHGRIAGDRVHQVKGFPYHLTDLIPDADIVDRVRGGSFVTLRLTAAMYHRFHAPHDIVVDALTYLSGDCWNVNPIALKRVERLFCRNERAVIETRLSGRDIPVILVPVAAILVASIRLTFFDTPRTLREGGAGERRSVGVTLRKGDEMGWFEHGSTILVFVPPGVEIAQAIEEGGMIRQGEPLFRLPPDSR